MAKTTITNAYVQIVNNDASGNTFDLSDHVQSVTLKYSRETPESTSMGASAKGRLTGLQDCTVNLNLYQDYAAGKVDAALWELFNAASSSTITIKPANAAISATNPRYYGNVIVSNYEPSSGKVGDIAMQNISLPADGAILRAIT